MIPATFTYERARSVDDAVRLLSSEPEARILAGGQSLLPLMRLRLARPAMLVDIGRIEDLAYVREDDGTVAIGAMTRHHDVATSVVLQRACPILAYAAGEVGDPQIRHAGTIGGALAHADPAGDLGTVLLALGATLVARGPGGAVRAVPVEDFSLGFFETALAHDEVLTEIRAPKTGSRGWSYLKYHRRAIDWALVGVAVVTGEGGTPTAVTLTNMADRPMHAAGVEEALADGADPSTASARAAEGTSPPSDAFASAEYRQELVKVIARRALEEAMSR